jgi:hypothetical protein
MGGRVKAKYAQKAAKPEYQKLLAACHVLAS